jgi:hypothetical protein
MEKVKMEVVLKMSEREAVAKRGETVAKRESFDKPREQGAKEDARWVEQYVDRVSAILDNRTDASNSKSKKTPQIA